MHNQQTQSSASKVIIAIGLIASASMPASSSNNLGSFHPFSKQTPVSTSKNSSSRPKALERVFLIEEIERINQVKNQQLLKLRKTKRFTLDGGIDSLPEETISVLLEKGIEIEHINATEDNSVAFEFNHNNKYHLIEFFQDGDIVLLKGSGPETQAWDALNEDYFEKLNEHFLSVHE
ncbi:hypothetical protein [Siphonobacter curvatus]|uniref:Uncharacterized protein n=1 Tax=Siphonobacter curvatus TaxID=2094562 RepID=A0A2S7IR22_9BACT|nr:hypothetical protein [Siphonobacter curvatus]PQA60173.1 hypothetical protein C5O19_11300 [Siphonobacter curvatus]